MCVQLRGRKRYVADKWRARNFPRLIYLITPAACVNLCDLLIGAKFILTEIYKSFIAL